MKSKEEKEREKEIALRSMCKINQSTKATSPSIWLSAREASDASGLSHTKPKKNISRLRKWAKPESSPKNQFIPSSTNGEFLAVSKTTLSSTWNAPSKTGNISSYLWTFSPEETYDFISATLGAFQNPSPVSHSHFLPLDPPQIFIFLILNSGAFVLIRKHSSNYPHLYNHTPRLISNYQSTSQHAWSRR